MGADLTFMDPLVRIYTRRQNLRMFARLRRLFPASELTRFERLEATPPSADRTTTTYLMEIRYRRSAAETGHTMRSHLAVTTEGGVVVGLVEDWKAPVHIAAGSVPILHRARGLLGRFCGLSLSSSRRGSMASRPSGADRSD
jgi:hypothetical protein